MKTCIIFNPVARGNKARRFREQVTSLAAGCVLKPTSGPGAGRLLASEAVREGFETVVAAGGDGTLNEVVSGIADVPGALARIKLGVVPLGTVNVFAKELGLPTNVTRAWRVIEAGRTRQMDLLQAEYIDQGQSVRRSFVQMAGAGLDALAVERVDWELKKKLGLFAYVVACLQALFGPLPKIVASNGQESHEGQLVLLGNGRFYGGRFVLFPQADSADGLIEVTVFPKTDWVVTLRCCWNILLRRSPAVGVTRALRGQTIHLTCASSVPFQLEGENVGRLPAVFTVGSEPLRVIVP